MPFFVIPLTLSFGTQLSYECDVRSLEQQKDVGLIQSRVSPGLNSVKMSIAVNQQVTNGKELETFFNSLGGRLPFQFGLDAPPEVTGKLFKCKEFSLAYQGQSNGIETHELNATFTEVVRARV